MIHDICETKDYIDLEGENLTYHSSECIIHVNMAANTPSC